MPAIAATAAGRVAERVLPSPVAISASLDRVYVLGYNALQVFDADLAPVATVELEDGQLRAMALDAEHVLRPDEAVARRADP